MFFKTTVWSQIANPYQPSLQTNVVRAFLFAVCKVLQFCTTTTTTTTQNKSLCLHGFGSNAKSFEQSLATLQHSVANNCSFVYLDAETTPCSLISMLSAGAPTNGKCLWRMSPANHGQGWMNSLDQLMDFLNEEDIDGILGFSQGAAMVTVLLAELAEKQQTQPFAFACLFSGFIPSQKQMREKVLKAGNMFDDSVTSVHTASTTASQMNLFHCYAKEDIVIPSSKSIELVHCFENCPGNTCIAPAHETGHAAWTVYHQPWSTLSKHLYTSRYTYKTWTVEVVKYKSIFPVEM